MSQIKIISKSNYTGEQAYKNYQPPTQIKIDNIIAIGETPDGVVGTKVGSILDGTGEPVTITVSTSAIVFFKNFSYGNTPGGGTPTNISKYLFSTVESFESAGQLSIQQFENGVPVTAMPSTVEEINAKYNIRQAIVDAICGNNGSSISLVPIAVDYVKQDGRFTAEDDGSIPRPASIPPVEW